MLHFRRRQWHPTPVLLPGKSHGWRSLVGCSPWGPWGLDTTEQLHFHFSLSYYYKREVGGGSRRRGHMYTYGWYMLVYGKNVSHAVVSNSLWPHGLYRSRLLCPWDFPGKNTWVGFHALPSLGGLIDPGIELRSPTLLADFLSSEPPGKLHVAEIT